MATRHIECPVAISRDSFLQDTLLCTFYFFKVKEKKKRLQDVFISMKNMFPVYQEKLMCCVLVLFWVFFRMKELAYSMSGTFIAQPTINIYNQQNRSVIFIL